MRQNPWHRVALAWLVGSCACASGEYATAATVQEIASRAQSAVVQIKTVAPAELAGEGSGFVISPDGMIATNHHVVAGAREVEVRLANGARFDVEGLVASDEVHDLAVIKVKAQGLQPLVLGDPTKLQAGEQVVAVGNPLGLEASVSDGVVSAVRTLDEAYWKGDVIQTSAPISPGSSGGPLLNMNGEVVGVTAFVLRGGQNVNFAVPVSYLKPLMQKGALSSLASLSKGILPPRAFSEKVKVPKKAPFSWVPVYAHLVVPSSIIIRSSPGPRWKPASGTPARGEYQTTEAGTVFFNAADSGREVQAQYEYTPERIALEVSLDATGELETEATSIFESLGFEVVSGDEVRAAFARVLARGKDKDSLRRFAAVLNVSKLVDISAGANAFWRPGGMLGFSDVTVTVSATMYDLASGTKTFEYSLQQSGSKQGKHRALRKELAVDTLRRVLSVGFPGLTRR